MSNFMKWNLFITSLFVSAVMIYVIWSGEVSAALIKLIATFVILCATAAVVTFIGRSGAAPKTDAPGDQS